MELNDRQAFLLEKLTAIPPDLKEIKNIINEGKYSAEDVSIIGAVFIYNSCGYMDTSDPLNYIPIEPHSPYIYDAVKLLLKHGLDPNLVYDQINIMQSLLSVATPYVAADTLALLLENGGRVDLEVDGDRIFDDLDFDIIFGAYNQEARCFYDSWVHCWMVMIGYGARLKDGSIPVETYKVFDEKYIESSPFDPALLKEHQNYTFGISNVPGRGENWSLHIFDRRTFFEVARL